jgi:hypothetical protein
MLPVPVVFAGRGSWDDVFDELPVSMDECDAIESVNLLLCPLMPQGESFLT